MRTRRLIACAVAVGALIVGCQSGIPGTPVTSPESPTEPSFPTSRPTAAPPRTIAPSSPAAPPRTPTAKPPGDAEPLPPDDSGFVFVQTKSGKTRCQISEDAVGCEAQFTNSPTRDGLQANGVNVTADGNVEWLVGNLGDMPVVTLDYRTYRALGWTIAASSDGTRFTNGDTGHGMFVSVERVETY